MRTLTRSRSVLAAAGIAVLALAGCADDEAAEPAAPAATSAQAQGGVQEDDLEDRVGDRVEVTGQVNRLIAPYAFTLGGGEGFGVNPVLVVTRADLPDGLDQGDTVTVAGTVTEFEVAGYEADLDVDLVDDEFEDFDNDPAIQASSVTVK
jgi:hypothetical protein